MKSVVTMVKELDGTEITIVPSTVGKIVPDGTPEEEWTWAVEGLKEIHEHAEQGGRRDGDRAAEPIRDATSSTAASRRWHWPTRWRPTSACAWTAST